MQGYHRAGTLQTTPVLGYWKIRGMGAAIRYQLEHCGVNYDLDEYEQGGKETNYSREQWTEKKYTLGLDFPNLPYLIDGSFKLTETLAIHRYIAEKWNPELLGKTPEIRARVSNFAYVIHDLKMRCTMPCYQTEDGKKTCETYRDEEKGLKPVMKAMGSSKYLCGDDLTYMDFYFFEFLQLLIFASGGKVLEGYPALKTYNQNIKEVEGLKEYIEDEDCPIPTLPFNNVVAKFNGT